MFLCSIWTTTPCWPTLGGISPKLTASWGTSWTSRRWRPSSIRLYIANAADSDRHQTPDLRHQESHHKTQRQGQQRRHDFPLATAGLFIYGIQRGAAPVVDQAE